MALDPERRRQLHAMKLRSLAGEYLDASIEDIVGNDDGAIATLSDRRVAALAEERPERALGWALASAARSAANEVHIFASGSSDVLARRAQLFSGSVTIWKISDGVVTPAVLSDVVIEKAAPHVPELISTLEESGLEVVIEHGVIVGEVAGLEVARIISDEQGDRIEVGVGAHDREVFAMLHGNMPTVEAIEQVANVVRSHRLPGAEPHPLNRLGAERWLRSHLVAQPARIGVSALITAPPPVPRTNLKEAVPAVATGRLPQGDDVVVVCAVGIDLDLIPFAADARLLLDPQATLMVVVPQRDAHSILYELSDQLVDPAVVAPIDDGWREWTS